MNKTAAEKRELGPRQLVRMRDAGYFFGLSPTQIALGIKMGEIPEPFPILGEGGRACGWLGETIIAWQDAQQAKAKTRREAELEAKTRREAALKNRRRP